MPEYIICFNQRSGSSWLADLLTSAGLGPCREFLGDSDLEDFSDCMGIKIAAHVIKEIEDQIGPEIKLIYLDRRDRLRQAISFYRAFQTDRWSCFDKGTKPDPPFSRDGILEGKAWLDECEVNWRSWLEDRHYLQLWYEDLGEQTVYQIAKYIGRPALQQPTTYFTIQRDTWTEMCYYRMLYEQKEISS